ncbi:putative uncharacterized protein [Waddlia chondrophila 2032/99]|uniref:Uncharacterized protein n=2 Tax=Waddlia chondrophila TaxID=71667 RepID=D6YVB8_WADCW|nr:hypothetical protein [Waddlia chondrophila]ADI38079.1 hypothetical protein wcw_0712 [Waddlia chondrophila WSU 86-1044]CCB91220.1 putative uncharacterized protein [Waddlia chondrophila 2032/99]
MGKMNYSKVEEALTEGLYKMKVNQILESSKNKDDPKALHPAQKFIAVVQELKWIKKTSPDIYKKIKISKKEISSLAEIIKKRRDSLKESEVKRIDELLEIIKKYKKKEMPQIDDEDLIEEENDRHHYKRHNVSEKWIPLDVPRN